MSRSEFPIAVKREAAARSGGVCECHKMSEDIRGHFPKVCDRPAAEFDHVLADTLGGKPTLDNCAHLSKPCHLIKTATDQKARAKRNKHTVRKDRPKPRKQPSRKPQSGGFNTLFKRTIPSKNKPGRTVRRGEA